VLGSIEIEIDGVLLDLGGPSPRRLLAALIAADGSPVSDTVLAEVVWGGGPPKNFVSGLRVLVSRLRAALGPDAQKHLRRIRSGYSFDLPPEAIDHCRFSDLVGEGRRRLAAGDARRAVDVFESALALWRGHPWPELDDSMVVYGARATLVELQALAVEELQAARLKLGDTATAVAALSAAVAQAPHRERRWELLVLGLYRSGRQAHALAELRRARGLLADELGIEPGPALGGLEQRILIHDPTLLGTTPAALPLPPPDPATPPRPVVAQPGIARPLSSLVGRAHELKALDDLLAHQRLVTLLGPAGVGKTRVALEHATGHNAGEVWQIRLADIHAARDVAAAVAAAAGVVHLGGDPVAQIQHALAHRPGLLVLDNCEHLVEPVAELTLQLLTRCPELRILATSRTPLGIDGEHTTFLQPLPLRDEHGGDGAAVQLLFDRVRLHRAGWTPSNSDRQAAREICTTLDGLPLAIELAAARERAFGLDAIVTHLSQRLDVLGTAPKGLCQPAHQPAHRHRLEHRTTHPRRPCCAATAVALRRRVLLVGRRSGPTTQHRRGAGCAGIPGGPLGGHRRHLWLPSALPDAGNHPPLLPRRGP